MYTLLIIFIIAVLIIGIFCVAIVCRDIIVEERARKKSQVFYQPQAVMPVAENNEMPTETVMAEEPEENLEEIVATETEKTVAFAVAKQTLDEKYLELSAEEKNYYDEIVRCANIVEGTKRFKNAGYEEYKIGKSRLIRLKIKNGVIVCELTISNFQLKNYASDNKLAIKQAPTIIKVTDEASLLAVKDSIKIAVAELQQEKDYKKEQAKLRRKQRRELERNSTKK